MDKFPNNFHRENFAVNPDLLMSKRRIQTEKYRKLIYDFINENSNNLPNSIEYVFDRYITSDISQKITAELRNRGFRVSCNYDIYRDRVLMKIT